MPTNLLILPFLGGYWFLSKCYLTKYHVQRHDGYRLVFYSAIAGLVLLGIPLAVEYYLFSCDQLPEGKHVEYLCPFLSSFGIQGSGTALLGALLGLIAPGAINTVLDLRHRRIFYLMQAIDHGENEFEKLIKESWESSIAGSKQVLLSFTLKSREVYIGIPLELPVPSRSNHISVLPIFAGYRDKDTLQFIPAEDYWDYYKRSGMITAEGIANEDFDLEQYRLVLSEDSIDTVGIFDLAFYSYREPPETAVT